MPECCPSIACLLTDPCGNPVSPYDQGAIVYASPLCRGKSLWSVATEGYVAVFAGGRRASPPIPFCIISPFRLSNPEGCSISFHLKSFHSWTASGPCCDAKNGQLRLLLSIETIASSRKCGNFLIPVVNPDLSPPQPRLHLCRANLRLRPHPQRKLHPLQKRRNAGRSLAVLHDCRRDETDLP